jgi:ubiquinone/menaquinone biosynthesis C-methylase UbiE
MKTNWDYTLLANAYLKRPDYSIEAIEQMLKIANISSSKRVCDVGAGVAHLTLMLLERNLVVDAVEPNDSMRLNGISRTEKFNKSVNWFEGIGENTGMDTGKYDMVTFGSSFNVCNTLLALAETNRILKEKGWFACMWNHRDLNDNIQSSIESIIKTIVKDYGYGLRRQDQTEIINNSGLFGDVIKIEGTVIHTQNIKECIEAWRSHATLERQAKEKFSEVIFEIEKYLNNLKLQEIKIPYTTRIWLAQKK